MITSTESSGIKAEALALISKLKSLAAKLSLLPIYARLGGRSFLIVAFFAITGFLLERDGKLTDSYAALATALSGFHIWRATCQDKCSDKKDE